MIFLFLYCLLLSFFSFSHRSYPISVSLYNEKQPVYSVHSLQRHDVNEARFTLVFEYS